MQPIPTNRRLPRNTTIWKLGCARRGRFLQQFDEWMRKFRSLERALKQAGMTRRVYYRWKKGQVVPRETALRRYCLHTGIDAQFVLTGIPGKVGKNHLTIWHYQEQHRLAKTEIERSRAFGRLAMEVQLLLQDEVPAAVLEGTTTKPKQAMVITCMVSKLYGFDIAILPLPDGRVGFEVYRVENGKRKLTVEGWCDEGALHNVCVYLRENIRAYRKRIKEEDVLTPFLKKEAAFTTKYNARYR